MHALRCCSSVPSWSLGLLLLFRPAGLQDLPHIRLMVILHGLHLGLAGIGYTLYPELFPRGVALHHTLPNLRTPPIKGAKERRSNLSDRRS